MFGKGCRGGGRWALGALEGVFWASGIVCVAVLCFWSMGVKAAQRASQDLISSHGVHAVEASAVTRGSVIGKLVIADIGLSVPILESYDPGTLAKGVGHIPGTAVPGGLGNLGLAGHRDTFFRPLRNIREGMQIQIGTADGTWEYAVDRTEIVLPERVSVLDIGERPEMTLITCYPFDYVGAAPKRFIVHAHLLSAAPTH
jgi:sortase A